MILLIDKVASDALPKSVVKMEAVKRAVLVQDAGQKGDLFALLMVDDRRAVLVAQGALSLGAGTIGHTLKLQTFRSQLDKADVRTRELRFCVPGTYQEKLVQADHFNPEWFVKPTFQDVVTRFALWRAGRANW
jgi:hypothetical protein